MKFYYAVFNETKEAIEVEFPDLPGCVTFGKTWEEAVDNAVDVLAGWLANAEPEFIKEPSPYVELSTYKGKIMPITVDENIKRSYTESKRFNVIFPANVLRRVDEYRRKQGLKRSTLLLKAVEEYLAHHQMA